MKRANPPSLGTANRNKRRKHYRFEKRYDVKQDSEAYLKKKAFFEKMLTIYGRQAVLEALKDDTLHIYKLHLCLSNKPATILERIVSEAKRRDIPIAYHDKKVLSRISKNARQDQGVALDIVAALFTDTETFLATYGAYRVIARDDNTNPQNVGMIVRSCAAGAIDAIVLPSKGTASITPLTVKASAGTLFKIPIVRTDSLRDTLTRLKENGATLYTLSSHASSDYKTIDYPEKAVFILGNESEGVSEATAALCDESIAIAMRRGVESLNVAVTAALLAFM